MASDISPNDEKGTISEADRRELKQRLDDLGGKLDAVKSRQPKNIGDDQRRSAMGMAFRLSVEMVAGVIVGGILGYALDTWFGTWPVLLILCLVFGASAGIFNAIRAARKMQDTV
jgi:ATP synthase protein I